MSTDPSALATELLRVMPASGYANIHENNKFPMIEKYRSQYEEYVASPKQAKMLVTSSNGGFYSTKNATLEEAHSVFDRCLAQKTHCWVYALNNQVVWSKDPSFRISRDQLKPLITRP